MPSTFNRTLRQLRGKRDLRAEILALAGNIASGEATDGELIVEDPAISPEAVQTEWHRALGAIAQPIGTRMRLTIERNPIVKSGRKDPLAPSLLLDRPNYRFEVLRLLIGASLEDGGPQSQREIMQTIGASQTPIRHAAQVLRNAGITDARVRGLEVDAADVTWELLTALHATPQMLRFRFQRGAMLKTPSTLVSRATQFLGASGPKSWRHLSLSGVPVALTDVAKLDIIGIPRLDLVAHVPRQSKTFDTMLLRQLDDGLEIEPNGLVSAPVVVTVIRAEKESVRDVGVPNHPRSSCPMDVLLSLLNLGLREQAVQYTKAIRAH